MSTPPDFRHTSCVYFARVGKYVKIGYSSDPVHRMAGLLQGRLIIPADIDHGAPIELIHTIPDCRVRDERIVQNLFGRHHAEGEWFHHTLDFARQLAGLQYVTDHQRALDRMAHKRAQQKHDELARSA